MLAELGRGILSCPNHVFDCHALIILIDHPSSFDAVKVFFRGHRDTLDRSSGGIAVRMFPSMFGRGDGKANCRRWN